MSGIYGIVTSDPVDPVEDAMAAMEPAIKQWGGHRHGAWVGPGVGMGHELLLETPEGRHERQPVYTSESGGWRLVADARLDNRTELRAALAAAGLVSDPVTDPELILSAWCCWGEDCLDRLVGSFALAFWHEARRELLLVRDHLGLRPLVYHADARHLVFASDVNAVRAAPGVPDDIDESALLAYVHRYYRYFWDKTCLAAVRKLPPGHWLRRRDGRTEIGRYWHPEKIAVNTTLTRKAAADELRCTIDRAVRSQLRSIGPVGVHLSGGLDSSAVAILANDALRECGRSLAGAYTWTPLPQDGDWSRHHEHRVIPLIEQAINLKCHHVSPTLETMRVHLARNPVVEPMMLRIYEEEVCRQAQSDGVGVILSGYGGDEFASASGRGIHSHRFWHGHWWDLARMIAHTKPSPLFGMRVLMADLWDTRPAWMRLSYAKVRSIDDDKVAYTRAERRLLQEWARQSRWTPHVHSSLVNAWRNGHMQRRVEDWAMLAPRHGVVHRYPLLDRRVVELVLSFPDSFFARQGFTRYVMRQAFSGVLPPEICWARHKREPARVELYRELERQVCAEILAATATTAVIPDPLQRMYRRLARLRADRIEH